MKQFLLDLGMKYNKQRFDESEPIAKYYIRLVDTNELIFIANSYKEIKEE